MRAAVIHRYGPPDVVQVVDDHPRPTAGPQQVLVEVHSAAVTSADARIRAARFPRGFAPFARLAFGLRRPRRPVLGSAYSGTVAAVGSAVHDVQVGDRVCGMSGARMGAHATYLAAPAAKVAVVPAAVTDDDAAGLLFGGSTALHFVQRSGIGPGARVLVVGGSGAVGSMALQLARLRGAHVTAVTGPDNLTMAKDLGADEVVDHRTTDLSTLPDRYDLVMDTVGVLSRRTGLPLLTPTGVLQLVVADLGQTVTARGRVQAGTSPERPAAFRELLDLVASGGLRVPLDQVGDLADIVQAHARIDSGRKAGNIVLHP